jgi:hypothetical protein
MSKKEIVPEEVREVPEVLPTTTSSSEQYPSLENATRTDAPHASQDVYLVNAPNHSEILLPEDVSSVSCFDDDDDNEPVAKRQKVNREEVFYQDVSPNERNMIRRALSMREVHIPEHPDAAYFRAAEEHVVHPSNWQYDRNYDGDRYEEGESSSDSDDDSDYDPDSE